MERSKLNIRIPLEEARRLEDCVFVDVRSPGEYEDDHILGAYNIPLLDNEERAIVGTLYKQEGKDEAVRVGLDLTSKKLRELYEAFKKVSDENKNVIVYCFRGGMRSSSLVDFLKNLGLNNLWLLEGGYKSYRNEVVSYFEKLDVNHKLIVLHGTTGVGKTDLLKELESKGLPVLDLEYIAKNSGSVFGNLYFNQKPPSQKYFESSIYEVMRKYKSVYLFAESESKRVGSVIQPENLYKMLTGGVHILVESSLENRIKRLVRDYTNLKREDRDEKLKEAIGYLKKRIGKETCNMLIEAVDKNDFETVAKKLTVDYYDSMYNHSIGKYEYEDVVSSDDFEITIEKLEKLYTICERS